MSYNCNLHKRILDTDCKKKRFQFLTGLNSGYEATKNQVIAMDPLPIVNKAHYIIQQKEKQKKLRENMQVMLEVEAYVVYKQGSIPTSFIKNR